MKVALDGEHFVFGAKLRATVVRHGARLAIGQDGDAVIRRTDGRKARYVDEPLDPGTRGDRRTEKILGPLDIHQIELLRGARLDQTCGVHDGVDRRNGGVGRLGIFDRAICERDVGQSRQELTVRALAHQCDDFVARLRQLLGDIRAEEARAPVKRTFILPSVVLIVLARKRDSACKSSHP